MKNDKYHESVMVREVLEELHIEKGSRIIDATLGTAGHSFEIINTGGDVLGIEADPKMLAIAKERVPEGNFVLGNFSDLLDIARTNNFGSIDGVLLDLGVSNLHLKNDSRGFSFSDPSQNLDMRLNLEIQAVKASDLLNVLDKSKLITLFGKILDYRKSHKLAELVINKRKVKPFVTVADFLEVTQMLKHKKGLNQATLPMLALRVAVNSELENLEDVLPKAVSLLKKGGKLLVITFHSGEDRIVKHFMGDKGKLITPSEEEKNINPRSRSAKLRVFTK